MVMIMRTRGTRHASSQMRDAGLNESDNDLHHLSHETPTPMPRNRRQSRTVAKLRVATAMVTGVCTTLHVTKRNRNDCV